MPTLVQSLRARFSHTPSPPPPQTLQAWMDAALGEMIPALHTRLTAEYHSHVQGLLDEGATEAEAVASLGDPKAVAKGLRRTYFTRQQMQWLRTSRKLTFLFKLTLSILAIELLVNIVLLGQGSSPYLIASGLGEVVGLLSMGLLWIAVRHRPAEVRGYLLAMTGQVGMWIAFIFQGGIGFMLNDSISGNAISLAFTVGQVGFLAAFLFVLRPSLACLNRTLRAEQAASLST